MTFRRLLFVATIAVTLAACGDDGTPEEGRVSGDVLEGTISDEMLPLEQVRSQAPLAEPSASGSASSSGGGDAAPAEDSGSSAEVAPEPAEPEAGE